MRTSMFVGLLFVCGCVEEQRYVTEREQVRLTRQTAPAFVNEQDEPTFIVERRFRFPIKRPGDDTLESLTRSAQGMDLPFPRLPWVQHDDLELALDYALENREDEALEAGIILNGINEFNEYTPGEEDFNQWEKRFALGPRERVIGTISELEMDEIAIDLATVVNGAPNSNQVVHPLSQSSRDPRIKRYIPAIIPGLVGVRAGILSGTAARVTLEITIRAQDHGDRLAERGEARWELPAPAPFVPVAEDMEP